MSGSRPQVEEQPEQAPAMERIRTLFSAEDRFARHSGIELLEAAPGQARVTMEIRPFHLNAAGTVHGGAIFTLADFAFAVASNSHGTLALGISTSISFLKGASTGRLFAEAREVARTPRLATYTVTVTNDGDEVVALFQGTVYRKKEALFPGAVAEETAGNGCA
ncbi:PaaI family thioesterase [Trichlorobacter ammonificans]|uniref:Esterase AF_2264 n=1 Tax=Trichlorobacter ammonificans TaxID=2916410 RepID=A0ABM9D714_9BACT|nr:hotdog fold thioesterase [Trichlorobacter ammonificans]CAH2030244.1 Putative esterase AF_2264 [Trichlorobacter ammonificans]